MTEVIPYACEILEGILAKLNATSHLVMVLSEVKI